MHQFQPWVVRIDPVVADDLLNAQISWNIVGANHSVSGLIPVIDSGLLITQWHAFETARR